MTVYTFTIAFMGAENNIEYSIISGIYAAKEDAQEAARKALKEQERFWEGSTARKIGGKEGEYVKVSLMHPDGYSKVYAIKAMEVL